MKSAARIYFFLTAELILLSFLFLSGSCSNVFEENPLPRRGNDRVYYKWKAGEFESEGEWWKAYQLYSKVLEINPADEEARLKAARSYFQLVFSDFIDLYLENGSIDEFDLIFLIKMFDQTNGLVSSLETGTENRYKKISDILDSSNGIINGMGDGSVGEENIELNFMLLYSYLHQFIISLLDSNDDGYLSTDGDYVVFDADGEIGLGIDVEAIATEFETMALDMQSVTEIDQNANPYQVLTNLYSMVSNLKSAHDYIEDVFDIIVFIDGQFYYVDQIIAALLRPRSLWERIPSENGNYSNYYAEIKDSVTNPSADTEISSVFSEIHSVTNMAYSQMGTVNQIHFLLVGEYAYQGDISSYTNTPWESHSNGLKGTLITSIETVEEMISNLSLISDITDPSSLTNTNLSPEQIESIVTNLTNSFSSEQLSNIAGNFGGDSLFLTNDSESNSLNLDSVDTNTLSSNQFNFGRGY